MSTSTHRTSTMPDLRSLIEHEGPFLTATIPARSDVAGAADRFETHIENALRDAPDDWADDVAQMRTELSELTHDDGAAVIAIRPHGGPTFYEFIDDPVRRPDLAVGPLPRLAPLLEARQRIVPHVVVETDLAGADLVAFDGGSMIASEQVDGDTEHIHRGHPGGWSQRRFQQRAENTWEDNATDVADATTQLVGDVDARLVLVAGPTRAQSMVATLLEERVQVPVHRLEAGNVDGIAAEIVRYVADVVATDTTELLRAFDEQIERRAASVEEVRAALEAGRVETLLVHDDIGDDTSTDTGTDGAADIVDRCIADALLTDADIRIVPNVAILDQGVAALLRW